MSDQYDAQTVIDEANAKLQEGEGGVNAAQMVYQSALLDWVDDVTMGGDMGDGLNSVREEIVKLWLAYADLNRKSNKVSVKEDLFYLLLVRCISLLRLQMEEGKETRFKGTVTKRPHTHLET